jgi:hypothetical protein
MGRRRLLGAIGPEARLVMITEAGTAKEPRRNNLNSDD